MGLVKVSIYEIGDCHSGFLESQKYVEVPSVNDRINIENSLYIVVSRLWSNNNSKIYPQLYVKRLR